MTKTLNFSGKLGRGFGKACAVAVTCAALTGTSVSNVAATSHPALIDPLILGAAKALPSSMLLADRTPNSACPFTNLRQQFGQMLVVGFHGRTSNSASANKIRQNLARGDISGVILMSQNIGSRRELASLTRSLHEVRAPMPAIISVDQEGGAVMRLRRAKGFKSSPSAKRVAMRYSPSKAREVYDRMAEQLAKYRINLNFGPVADLNINPRNPIIGSRWRSYGPRPSTVTRFARTFIDAHRNAGILTSLKHFPGHGSSKRDTHKGVVNISKTWQESELAPYRNMLASDHVDTIMVGHLFHQRFTEEGRLPASLSAPLIAGVLREKLGYQGVVITDDMNMAAITKIYTEEEALIRAINAGNDIILYSKSGTDKVDRLHAIVAQAVKTGTIDRKKIAASCARITALKQQLPGEANASPERRLGLTP